MDAEIQTRIRYVAHTMSSTLPMNQSPLAISPAIGRPTVNVVEPNLKPPHDDIYTKCSIQ
jgi:hypothetical protein